MTLQYGLNTCPKLKEIEGHMTPPRMEQGQRHSETEIDPTKTMVYEGQTSESGRETDENRTYKDVGA